MPGPVGVGDDDLEVGLVEGEVVVAAVPEDDVGFLLGLAEDGPVVDAGVDDDAVVDVGLVLLALLDRALVLVEVGVGGEALDLLLDEVAVGHRVADGDDAAALLLEDRATLRLVWLLPEPVRTAQTETTGLRLLIIVSSGPRRTKLAPGGQDLGGLVHDVFVGEVAVGEDDVVDLVAGDELVELGLGLDRDALRDRASRPGRPGYLRPSMSGIWVAVKATTW